MQALKALVVFMGILIFIAMGFLVYGLLTRIDDGGPAAASSAPGKAFGRVASALPAGASVDSVAVQDGRIVVHVQLADGGAEVRVFDLANGAALGTVRLQAAP